MTRAVSIILILGGLVWLWDAGQLIQGLDSQAAAWGLGTAFLGLCALVGGVSLLRWEPR